MKPKLIPLVEAPRILRDAYQVEISYRKLYGLVLDGMIPANKDPHSGRWMIPENQLSMIENHLNKKQ